jgi:hypothetical protein
VILQPGVELQRQLNVVFFVLSFSAVAVLFGSVAASLAWLMLGTLRLLVRFSRQMLKAIRTQRDGHRPPA